MLACWQVKIFALPYFLIKTSAVILNAVQPQRDIMQKKQDLSALPRNDSPVRAAYGLLAMMHPVDFL